MDSPDQLIAEPGAESSGSGDSPRGGGAEESMGGVARLAAAPEHRKGWGRRDPPGRVGVPGDLLRSSYRDGEPSQFSVLQQVDSAPDRWGGDCPLTVDSW